MRRRSSPDPGNLFFVLAAWQALPGPLRLQADSISVLIPWGSLLAAAALAEAGFIDALKAISADEATVEIVTAIHPATDAAELHRLHIAWAGPESMAIAWREHGFDVRLERLAANHPYQTTWWRRIRHREDHTATRMTVRLP